MKKTLKNFIKDWETSLWLFSIEYLWFNREEIWEEIKIFMEMKTEEKKKKFYFPYANEKN